MVRQFALVASVCLLSTSAQARIICRDGYQVVHNGETSRSEKDADPGEDQRP
jgi:hypothetical protein